MGIYLAQTRTLIRKQVWHAKAHLCSTILSLVVLPFLFVLSSGIVTNFFLPSEEQLLHPSVLATFGGDDGAMFPRCFQVDRSKNNMGRIVDSRLTNCKTFAYSPNTDAVNNIVNTLMRKHGLGDDEVVAFDNKGSMVKTLSEQQYGTFQFALSFPDGDLLTPMQDLDDQIPAEATNPAFAYTIHVNETALGRFQDLAGNDMLRRKTGYSSHTLQIQRAVNEAILESQAKPSSEVDLVYHARRYPEVSTRGSDFGNSFDFVESEYELFPIGSALFLFLTLSYMMYMSHIIQLAIFDKETHMRDAMRTIGVKEGAYFTSLANYIIVSGLCGTICMIAGGLAGGVLEFQRVNFFPLFLTLYAQHVLVAAFGLFVSSFIHTSVAANALSFMMALVALLFQFLVLFRTLDSTNIVTQVQKILASSNGISLALHLFPLTGLAKVFLNWNLSVYSPRIGEYTAEDFFNGAHQYANPLGLDKAVASLIVDQGSCEEVANQALNYGCYQTADGDLVTFQPDVLSFVYMLVFGFLYLLLAWYTAQIVGNQRPEKPWFIFTPSFWFPKAGTKSSKVSTVANAAADDEEAGPAGDAGVVAERGAIARGERDDAMLLIKNLTKRYKVKKNSFNAVDNLSLAVDAGNVFALLGHNGAGKSTTVSMLTGLNAVTSGDAFIDGHSIRTDLDSVKKKIGVCPQHDILLDYLSAKQHLVLFGRLQGMSDAAINVQAEDLLAKVKLETSLGPVGGFSGGMKRRLSVAIAALGDNKVIFLDEPTTGMDILNRIHVWDVISKLKEGRVIVLTTHSMQEAEVLANRIGVVVEGRLSTVGDSLTLKSTYGGGYRIKLIVDEHDTDKVADRITSIAASAKMVETGANLLIYDVPVGANLRDLASMFDFIQQEMAKEDGLLMSWEVSQTTLDDVFLRVNKDFRTKEEDENIADGMDNIVVKEKDDSPEEEYFGFVAKEEETFRTYSLDELVALYDHAVVTFEANKIAEAGLANAEKGDLRGLYPSFKEQFSAMRWKVTRTVMRVKYVMIVAMIVPAGLSLMILAMASNITSQFGRGTYLTNGFLYGPPTALESSVTTKWYASNMYPQQVRYAEAVLDEFTDLLVSGSPVVTNYVMANPKIMVTSDSDDLLQRMGENCPNGDGSLGDDAIKQPVFESSGCCVMNTVKTCLAHPFKFSLEARTVPIETTDEFGTRSFDIDLSERHNHFSFQKVDGNLPEEVCKVAVVDGQLDTFKRAEGVKVTAGSGFLNHYPTRVIEIPNDDGTYNLYSSPALCKPGSFQGTAGDKLTVEQVDDYIYGQQDLVYRESGFAAEKSSTSQDARDVLNSNLPPITLHIHHLDTSEKNVKLEFSLQTMYPLHEGDHIMPNPNAYPNFYAPVLLEGNDTSTSYHHALPFNVFKDHDRDVHKEVRSEHMILNGMSTALLRSMQDADLLDDNSVLKDANDVEIVVGVANLPYDPTFENPLGGKRLLPDMEAVTKIYENVDSPGYLLGNFFVYSNLDWLFIPRLDFYTEYMLVKLELEPIVLGLLLPMMLSIHIPGMVFMFVFEKESRLRAMMQISGLRSSVYWIGSLYQSVLQYFAVNVYCFLFVFFSDFQVYSASPFVFVFLVIVGWGCLSSSFSLLLSNVMDSTSVATTVAQVVVIVSILVSYVGNIIWFPLAWSAPAVWYLWPPFVGYRAMHLLSLRSYTYEDYAGEEIALVTLLLFVEMAAIMLVAAYLDLVHPGSYAVPRHPLLCLGEKASKANVRDELSEEDEKGLAIEVRTSLDSEDVVDSAVLQEKYEVRCGADNETTREQLKNGVVVNGISKRFVSKPLVPGCGETRVKDALQGLHLRLKAGECFGMLGPNGAGKTTAISILTGLQTPSTGNASILGKSIVSHMHEIRVDLGMCPQFDVLFPTMTVYEHLEFYTRLKGCPLQSRKSVVNDALNSVELVKHMNKEVRQLSGGMKRRLSIAIALVGEPSVAILDEPTTGLDPATKRLIWTTIYRAVKKHNICTLLTTHSMEEAEALCPKLGIMIHGELKRIGTPNELKTRSGAMLKLDVSFTQGASDQVEEYLTKTIPGIQMESGEYNQGTFILAPETRLSSLSVMLSNEGARESGILFWGIRQTSLDDVFLDLAQKSEDKYGTA